MLSFLIFSKNLKTQNGRHFRKKRKTIWKLGRECRSHFQVGRKFRRNRSILHGLGDTANLKFLHILRKFKMAIIFGNRKNFWKLGRVSCLHTLGAENFDEIALSSTVLVDTANCVFAKILNSRLPPWKFF